MSEPIRISAGSQLGRYRILSKLGAGAMGEVFLAEDPQIGRKLALKTVRVEEGKAAEIGERKLRLLREARAAGKMLHPNIVTLFDAGEDQGTLYLAFEWVDGKDLAGRIADGPPLSLAEALAIVRQAAEALDYAHRQGVVHRDIKPSNLMITTDGRVKVADFGIAKVLDQTSDLTMTGSVVGSPHYLSPEQIRGDELDGRTDIFSLGVLLYEILCNRRPFEGDTLTTLVYRILNQDPTPIIVRRPDLGPRLERLVRRMLNKEREQRFATAGEAAAEIAACERELAPALLAALAVPEAEVSDATLRLPSEASTVTPARPVVAAAPQPPPPPPPPAARLTASPAAATSAPASSSRLILVAVGAIAFVVALVVAGLGARSWLAARATTPATALAERDQPTRVTPGESPVASSTLPTDSAEEPAASPAVELPSEFAGREASEPEPSSVPFRAGERPRLEALRAAAAVDGNRQVQGPRAGGGLRAADRPQPDAAAESRGQELGGRANEPVPEAAAEPDSSEATSATAADPQSARDALIARLPVEREMKTGMSLSFEILPKDAAERVVVRVDRIVIGRAAEWNAKKRDGRAYSINESGLHIVSFLVDGAEVYRMRIDAQPGSAAPTPIAVNLPQASGRLRRGARN